MNGHGGRLGHVTWAIYINFRSPFPKRLHMKFGIDWKRFQRKRCLKIMVMHMNIAPGQGQTTPVVKLFHKQYYSVNIVFC